MRFQKGEHTGENNHNWKGGRRKHSSGYIEVLTPNHPFCMRGGYIFEHRYVMEQHLGRYLTTDEVVHHKNGNKSDNRIENLELMTKSKHMQHHMTIDMSDRICSECGSDTTKLVRTKYGWKSNWCFDSKTKKPICMKCYRHRYWMQKKK